MGTKLHKNIGEASTVPAAAKTVQSANARRSHGAVSASVRSSTPTKPCISSRLRVVGEMAAIVHLLMMLCGLTNERDFPWEERACCTDPYEEAAALQPVKKCNANRTSQASSISRLSIFG